jgi:hypothetical protein
MPRRAGGGIQDFFMNVRFRFLLLAALGLSLPAAARSQHSVARQWNEALLEAIRHDLARPTVHARNLFHTAVAMYDAWAAYDTVAQTYFLGKTVGGFYCPFTGVARPADVHAAREEAVSYAAYRLLMHRFQFSPGAAGSLARFDSLMNYLGYDTSDTSSDYTTQSPAALGNYIGGKLIEFGLQDGSNEQNNYAYLHYQPVNPPLVVVLPGDPTLVDPNRWQPLALDTIIDQGGNVIPGNITKFVSPEWGELPTFALTTNDRTLYSRDGYTYKVYDDPGPLVAVWSSHLKAMGDTVLWDISPASIGNNPPLPQTLPELESFYKLTDGGDQGTGRTLNPRTGLPYTPQLVPRGDYTRVLAEFWADGPNSETPPGHWFTILNYVSDHPLFQKRFKGIGPIIEDLEWDVKAYLALGGAVHDAAVSCWGIKGWYDFVRPISAIRWMADHGQCSDSTLPHFSHAGIPLIPGFIELVQAGDSLAGAGDTNVGKIKLFAWRGSRYIADPKTDVAGVGWILAGDWVPYQRPTFVTPPFAGYTSGHSTYSRASAEVLTLLTGDDYFPGGMGEFYAPKNQYLVFEDGPSVDVTLQWATYRDAADQCSLSRIWGGIHPPTDDMPGRLIGRTIGQNAFTLAEAYFTGQITSVQETAAASRPRGVAVYPNPVSGGTLHVQFQSPEKEADLTLYDILGRQVITRHAAGLENPQTLSLSTASLASGMYLLRVQGTASVSYHRIFIVK